MTYENGIEQTPIDTKNVNVLRDFATRLTEDHSFDLFSGLYRFNRHAPAQVAKLRQALDTIDQHLQNDVRINASDDQKGSPSVQKEDCNSSVELRTTERFKDSQMNK